MKINKRKKLSALFSPSQWLIKQFKNNQKNVKQILTMFDL